MIQSMTGYGKSSYDLGDKTVIFEIKSLNSKQLDLYIRLPNGYREKEMDIRNEIANRIRRGKVEVNVSFEYHEGKQATQINAAVVKDYYNQLKEIASEIGLSDDEPILQSILRMPEALNTEKQSVDADESEKLMISLNSAIDELDKYRSTEGAALAKDISGRIGMIENYLEQIVPFEK